MRAHASYRPDYAKLASGIVVTARQKRGETHAQFADYLSELLGWSVQESAVRRWETRKAPPGDVLMVCINITQDVTEPGLADILAAVPSAFPAEALAGPWVTAYQFMSGGRPHHHADVAVITVVSGNRIRAVNHPPEPRSEGRSVGFRNEIVAALVGRHLVGEYVNTSDHRYYGTVQLAVHSGETVMEGIYAGVGSDVEVSRGDWKWVRLEAEPDVSLSDIQLREAVALYELVMSRTRNDEPLTLADIGEEH
jgi:hypothetical protein